jgi:hypothetical protein
MDAVKAKNLLSESQLTQALIPYKKVANILELKAKALITLMCIFFPRRIVETSKKFLHTECSF